MQFKIRVMLPPKFDYRLPFRLKLELPNSTCIISHHSPFIRCFSWRKGKAAFIFSLIWIKIWNLHKRWISESDSSYFLCLRESALEQYRWFTKFSRSWYNSVIIKQLRLIFIASYIPMQVFLRYIGDTHFGDSVYACMYVSVSVRSVFELWEY